MLYLISEVDEDELLCSYTIEVDPIAVDSLEELKLKLLENLKFEDSVPKNLSRDELEKLLNDEILAEKDNDFWDKNNDRLTGDFCEYFECSPVEYYYKTNTESRKVGESLGSLVNLARENSQVWWDTYNKLPRKVYKKTGPKRSRSAYLFFFTDKRTEIKNNVGDTVGNPYIEVIKQIAKMWKNLSEEDKEPYQKMATEDKVRYETELKALT